MISTLLAATGLAQLAVVLVQVLQQLVQVWVLVRLVAVPWMQLPVSLKLQVRSWLI